MWGGMEPDRLSHPGNPSACAIGCLRRRRAPLCSSACHINKRSVCMIAAISSDLCLRVKRGRAVMCDKTHTVCSKGNRTV